MKKNGKIEFYRFIFCVAVLLFHAEKEFIGLPPYNSISLGLFPHGSMGVEFFFLVSGYFLARSALARRAALGDAPLFSRESSADSVRFLWKKLLRIFPEHTAAFVLTALVYILGYRLRLGETLYYILGSVPSFLLVQMSGLLKTNVIPVEWYLSAMLLAMAVIYPLCRRYYYGFTRCLAPLVAVLILGALSYDTHSLTGIYTWTSLGYKSLLRAVAGLLLGASAFEASRVLTEKKLPDRARRVLRAAEPVCVVLVLLYMVSTLPTDYEFRILGLLFVLLLSITAGEPGPSRFFDSRAVAWLGEFSFSLYLSQVAAIHVVHIFLKGAPDAVQVWTYLGLTLIAALAVRAVGGFLDRRFFRRLAL